MLSSDDGLQARLLKEASSVRTFLMKVSTVRTLFLGRLGLTIYSKAPLYK